MKRLCALVLLLAGMSPALAEATPDFQLYAGGKYDAAIRTGLARNDARGFADAARAALADETTREERCLPCLKRAEDYARRAIAAGPAMPDGHVYLAIALGLESRIEGTDEARRKGYPGEAKRTLDAALAAAPNNSWTLAALGGWNIEVVRGGGKVLGYLLFGATLDKGRKLYAAAFEAAPDNIALRYQYALTLSGYDAERFRGEIETSFLNVVKGKAGTAYDRLLQKRAGELLELLKKGDADAFAALARKYEGYP